MSTITYWPAGTVDPSYNEALWSFARAKYSNLRSYSRIEMDQTNANDCATFITTSGTVVSNASLVSGGVFNVASGVTAGGLGGVSHKGAAANIGTYVATKTGGSWLVAGRVRIASIVDADQNLFLGLFNIGTANVCVMGLAGPTSTTKFSISVAGTPVATATNITAINTWTTWALGYDGTTITAYAGDPQAGTMVVVGTSVNTSLPDGVAQPCIYTQQVAGAVSAILNVDTLWWAW